MVKMIPVPNANAKTLGQAMGEGWAAYHGDCVEVVRSLPDECVDYSIFSPPFASLYTYSNSKRDMGNCADADDFAAHFRHLAPELYRVLRPGRLLSFHCMQIPTSKTRHGHIGLQDFRGQLTRLFEEFGFIFHSEVVIWKDPVTAMQRTKALGLLHKQIKKDSAMSRQGIPDYLVTMMRPPTKRVPEADSAIVGALTDLLRHAFELTKHPDEDIGKVEERVDRVLQSVIPGHVVTMRKPGENAEPISHTAEGFPVERWQRYASPVWGEGEINPSRTLQYRSVREEKDERHICPLQLDVIERCIDLWTNPGDVVLTPFGGIGSEGVVAVEKGRKAALVEIKASYYRQQVRNLAAAEPGSVGKQAELFAV